MVTTMRLYLTEELDGAKIKELALTATDWGNYRRDSCGFFIEISHQHLDLLPEEVIDKKLFDLPVEKVTMMVGADWVFETDHPDGATFQCKDATASCRRFVDKSVACATFLIVGKTINSVLEMLKMLKDGDVQSYKDLSYKLKESEILISYLKKIHAGLEKYHKFHVGTSKTIRQMIKQERDEYRKDLLEFILWHKTPWYIRLFCTKPSVFEKYVSVSVLSKAVPALGQA